MNTKVLSALVIGGLIAGQATARNTYRYQGNGPWENLRTDTSGGWHIQSSDEPEYDPLPPFPHPAPGTGSEDLVRANWGGATVTLDFETTVWKFELGVDESGTFHIQDGGTLSSSTNSTVGNNNLCTGTLIIDAGGEVNCNGWMKIGANAHNNGGVTGEAIVEGTLNVTSHLWMASSSGNGEMKDTVGILTINDGGVVNVGENIGLGTGNAEDPSGGTATINVNKGGLLNLHHWSNENTDPVEGHDGSIQDGSVLNINVGGTVVVGGDRIAQVDAWLAEGKIATNAEELIVTFEDGKTTITTPPPPLTADISASGTDVTITWNGNADSLYNVWSSSDLTEDDLANWDPAASAIDGSETTVARSGTALFYRVEEYPKPPTPPVILNGDFDDPGGLPAGGIANSAPDNWVDDMLGTVSSWNPEDPLHFVGKPSGPFMVLMESYGFADGTAFGISQVLSETYADNTHYTVTVKAGNPKTYDWPGYVVQLWADGTLIASADDTTAGVPVDGKFVTVTLNYTAGDTAGLTPGSALEVKLLSRNVDVDNIVSPVIDWAVAFDDVTFASTPN